MSQRNRILDRLAKILARAASSNPHEAATARAMADQLMAEHGLTEADVSGHAAGLFELPMGASGFNATWKFALVTAAARYHGCEAIALQKGRKRKVRILGEQANVEKAAAFFAKLLEMVADLERQMVTRLMAGDLDAEGVDQDCGPRQASDSYRRGAVASLIEKMAVVRPEKFGRSKGSEHQGFSQEASVNPESDEPKRSWWNPRSWMGRPSAAKDLVVTEKKSEGHKEKIKAKYKPHMRPLRLDQAASDLWYWLGWKDVHESVFMADEPEQASPSEPDDTMSTDGQNKKSSG